jgi:3-hydroxyisobutyryl-CoA hydrolase
MVEGLKALFVDRTYKPKFNPATIEEVDLDELEKCFEPCPRRIFD